MLGMASFVGIDSAGICNSTL